MGWDHLKMAVINEVFYFFSFALLSMRMELRRLKISGCNFKWALLQKDYCVVLCFVSVLQDCISECWGAWPERWCQPVTIGGQSHEPRHNVTNVITDNELSRPELTMENSWEEIINALEVEKIQIYLIYTHHRPCTAKKHRAMALFWMLLIERVIE